MRKRLPPEARGLGEHHFKLLQRLCDAPEPLLRSVNTTASTVSGLHVAALVHRGLAVRTDAFRCAITPLGRQVLGEVEEG
jgi:hypothetical protein